MNETEKSRRNVIKQRDSKNNHHQINLLWLLRSLKFITKFDLIAFHGFSNK